MKRSEDTSRLPLASRFDRPSKKVAMAVSTKMMPIAVTSVLGVKEIFSGSGGGSKANPRSASSRFGAT